MCVSAVESLARSNTHTLIRKVSWKCMYNYSSYIREIHGRRKSQQHLCQLVIPFHHGLTLVPFPWPEIIVFVVGGQITIHVCKHCWYGTIYMFQTGSKPHFILSHCIYRMVSVHSMLPVKRDTLMLWTFCQRLVLMSTRPPPRYDTQLFQSQSAHLSTNHGGSGIAESSDQTSTRDWYVQQSCHVLLLCSMQELVKHITKSVHNACENKLLFQNMHLQISDPTIMVQFPVLSLYIDQVAIVHSVGLLISHTHPSYGYFFSHGFPENAAFLLFFYWRAGAS